MSQETTFGIALKEAVKTMSKKQQVKLITEHIYQNYHVFQSFKPLAIGIDNEIISALSQFESKLVLRALSNHCRRPKYLERLLKGGKRYSLNGKVKGQVTEEEMKVAKEQYEALSKLLDERDRIRKLNQANNEAKAKQKAMSEKSAEAGEASSAVRESAAPSEPVSASGTAGAPDAKAPEEAAPIEEDKVQARDSDAPEADGGNS